MRGHGYVLTDDEYEEMLSDEYADFSDDEPLNYMLGK